MKKVLAVILVMAMVFSLAACGNENKGIEINGLKYTLLPDGTYSVSAGEDIDNYKDIIIPSKIDGIAVTAVSDRAFQMVDNIQTVTIESGITSVGEYAFSYCESLTNITFPNTLTSISDNAFSNCENLTNITFPNTLTSIGNNAFGYCESLTSIDIPDNVTTISMDTFTHCINLTKVNLPDNLITIGHSAFAGCESLTSITIPYGTKTITNAAFANCKSLKSINIPDTVTSICYDPYYRTYSTFNNIEGLVINFSGTKMQWTNAFGDSLFLQSKQIVHCTDGDIHP